ncbi:bifunctional NADP phosphatase/NAD kinase [Methanocaldococcus villosus]|uniref:bifunctional NADP phosphatase/NAD kinase n=1 Tax=Methanocaldococcus villosus TaxID=667126 RepID=UPI0003760FBF|nr:bifunctional NADP phosphatase/NAD kinase [Methanocaldococcus villosus]
MLDIALKVVNEIDKKIKPLIGWEKAEEIVKIGADGTPTRRIDIIAENIAINVLKKFGGVLISEEIGLEIFNNFNYIYILDPIDGTYNALKSIPLYSTSIAIIKIKNEHKETLENLNKEELGNFIKNHYTIDDIKLGVVKNLATGEIYYAIKGEGCYLKSENQKKRLYVSKVKKLKEATIGLSPYGLSNNGLLEFLKERRARRIRLFGSTALELCFVANNALDAYVNINNNSRLCDIAAGYIICKEANAIVTDKNGKPLNLKIDLFSKTSLIVSNKHLHKKLIALFGNKWVIKPISFGIVVREDKKSAIELAKKVCNYLKERNIPYYVESFLKDEVGGKEFDISKVSHIIAIGGDGTILKAARIVGDNPIPILSINMGNVGFLANFNKKDIFKAINMIIEGDYEIEIKSRVQCKINNNKKTSPALNEVVVITKHPAKMLEFNIYINDKLVEHVRADGIIVASPNGSTAYSLSAGGPIVEPSVECFIISPICPFKLSSRPMVVSILNKIKIELLVDKPALVVVDGNVEGEINKGDILTFERGPDCYFIKGKDFYEKLKNFGIS